MATVIEGWIDSERIAIKGGWVKFCSQEMMDEKDRVKSILLIGCPWTSVKDSLPDSGKMVLVFAPLMNEAICTMYYHRDEGEVHGEWVSEPPGPSRLSWCALKHSDVTHWMSLPPAPVSSSHGG